ncbi:tyrosine-protein phosphatase non-receptor type 13 isoform X2 [Exaiptasia diaphana]|uniref:protein-tyrosine-phosphatase n=1 Tax=Exaiptasia diaphana TaxID=2652724 RepID=A0A913Y8M1_EXADI|nr:tyrosine-protein phosphatase non-receptor type 13 isoform X2 [Exaiptasia diaphana]
MKNCSCLQFFRKPKKFNYSTLNDPRKQEPNQQDDAKERLLPPQDLEVSKPRDVLASPEREIRVIKLRKEPFKGLGITVLGGENSRRLDLGIYVKAITEGGAAAKDGRLKAGDRILAVNGNSLEQVTHEKAVSLLKTTSSTVELVVSQSPHNVSALDLSNIPGASSTNEEPQTLEVKPLITPPQHGKRYHVESPWSSNTQSPTESPASTFNFPSEDEPVTMISKSISSLAANPPSYEDIESPTAKRKVDKLEVEESVPEPVTMTTAHALNSAPNDITARTKFTPPLAKTRLDSLDSHQSEMSSESYTAGSERSTDLDISDKSFIVELEKVDGSLGLSVTGGINTTVKHGAIYVKSLILNGPADRNGRVRVGDRILEVNGISLKSVTHKQAVEIIKRTPQHCKILIDRSIHVNVPTSIKKTRNPTPDEPFVVELRKGIGGLGLSLVGGRDADPQHGGLLRIKKMFPGQPAALSNQLQLGDIVLEVNGNSLENASHQDAINMIRHEPSIVRLLVKRSPSSIPAVLLSRASSDASDIDPVQLLNDIQSKLRTDAVKSPPQGLQTNVISESRPTSKSINENIISDELPSREGLPDRTEVWVKQESSSFIPRGFENDKPLTHQLSDPLARLPRHIEHEPITTSNSLPGKFALKSRYFDKVPEEKTVEKKESVSSVTSDLEKRNSGKIVSESDLPSLVKNLKSQDSLHRTMSPQAPLAEYEESDIDEGIMISVDDGTIMNISDDTDHDDDIEKTLINTDLELSYDKDDSTNIDKTDLHFSDSEKETITTYDNTTDVMLTAADHIHTISNDRNDDTLESVPPVTVNLTDNDDNGSIDDNSNSDEDSDEDIDSVLELLDAAHRDSKDETANLLEKRQDDKIILDIQEPEQAPLNHAAIMEKKNVYSTESEPELKLTETSFSETYEDIPDKSFSVVNGEVSDSDEESHHSDVNQDNRDETINHDSNQTDKPILTPKEELLTVELEKQDSGGLGFTLAGGADTMGGCFVRDIIGDPAKADGRLQKGDQILQVVNDGRSLETVNLTRTSRGRIGLLLTEGEEGIILVDDVVPGEPAAVEGNLKHGDRIVEIAGRKVDGIGFLAARQYLDASRPVVQLLVERRNQAAFSKYSMGGTSLEQSFSLSEDLTANLSQSDEDNSDQESDIVQETGEVIKVELEKGPRGFGFSLAPPSSESQTQGIFIKTISPGSVAEKDGRLQVGDQLLTVNEEDVRGLSHARVIGMLRKVTTTVTLEIRRPGDSERPSKQTTSTASLKNVRSSPPLNGVDLDITLEDKKTLTGSSEVKDEDDIVDLLSAISSTTESTPTSRSPTKPKLNKRDTDSVLSSLLNSIGSPAFSSNTNSLNETDTNESDSDVGSPLVDTGSPIPALDNRTSKSIKSDTLQRFSSGSLEGRGLSDSSTDRIKTDSEESSDSDYDDVDVFDMLHDNSERTKQEDSSIGNYIDLPPPLPTTPIPSDDEELPPLPPRKESLNRSSDDGWSSESDLSYQPKVNGFVSLHSSSSEGEMIANPNKPLVDVISGGRYTGHKLKMLIGALQTKLNSNGPSDEFKALREIKPTDNCDAAKHPDNKEKNRYRNVLPFNSTRVRLSGDDSEDYINASHIRVPVGQDTYHYIATQGPLPNTIKDFWQMVWEQGVEVIAMVTLEKEGGKIKCSKYWPTTPDVPLNLPKFQVSLVEEKTSQSFIERTLSLKHRQTGESIEVTHLNFTTWPDHGVPKCSVEMVQFVTYMRNLTSSQAPILVHCSAGIGRTGALITVDVSLGLIKRDQMFDVDKIIRILREQRQGMIQTKDQYIFCYTACLEVLRSLNG